MCCLADHGRFGHHHSSDEPDQRRYCVHDDHLPGWVHLRLGARGIHSHCRTPKCPTTRYYLSLWICRQCGYKVRCLFFFPTITFANRPDSFLVTFTLPYLLNADYANLQSRVGFIYGSISFVSVVCAWLFVPDCRGRSLEDINRLFESNHPARRFHKVSLEPLVDHQAYGSTEEGIEPTTAPEKV